MPSNRIKTFIERAYDNVHIALWAALIAALFYFAIVVVPHLPDAQARYQAQRALEINSEHDFYCRKWGMVPGNAKYAQCILDLQQFRRSVEKRLLDESAF